jgi:hypothetical protein
MATKGTLSRKAALKRSRRILARALRVFRASPTIAARAAVEHALDAVQRADQLAEHPQPQANEEVRRWEDAWLAAYMGLYRIARQRRSR